MNGLLFGTTERALADHAAVTLAIYGKTFVGNVYSCRPDPWGPGFIVGLELHVSDAPKVIPGMDGPTCVHCGGMTKRTGTCATCTSCGETTGCG